MAVSTELRLFETLAHEIGPTAALLLCAFSGGRTCYVPDTIPVGHWLRSLLGDEGASKLVMAHGGETLSIPTCELTPIRRAGMVHALRRHGLTDRLLARVIGVSLNRIQQIRKSLALEGFPDILSDEQAVLGDDNLPTVSQYHGKSSHHTSA